MSLYLQYVGRDGLAHGYKTVLKIERNKSAIYCRPIQSLRVNLSQIMMMTFAQAQVQVLSVNVTGTDALIDSPLCKFGHALDQKFERCLLQSPSPRFIF